MLNLSSSQSNSNSIPSAKQLEAQSSVVIHRWIEIQSEEAASFEGAEFTKMIIKMLKANDGYFIIDEQGKIWLRGKGEFFPLHDEHNGKNIGYRMARKAFN